MQKRDVPHSKPTVGEAEARSVSEVIASGFHSRGPKTLGYEERLASTLSTKFAHATSTGTAALQLALLALGAGTGKEVLIPSLTCAAVMNAVTATGATAVLYDGDYALPKADSLKALVTDATCAVVLVASPTGLESLEDFATSDGDSASLDGIPIVFDRCQQLARAASSPRPAVEVFSTYATKCISTGSGGAIATDDEALIKRVIDLNTHDGRKDYPETRYNFQFDDIRAAMGIVQLARLPQFMARRLELAEFYAQELGGKLNYKGIVYRYLVELESEEKCNLVQRALAKAGVESKRPVYQPLHRYRGIPDEDFPLASEAWKRNLSLPIYPTLTDEEQDIIVTYVTAAR